MSDSDSFYEGTVRVIPLHFTSCLLNFVDDKFRSRPRVVEIVEEGWSVADEPECHMVCLFKKMCKFIL